jgi:FixJ family two-component response regulator
MMVKPVVHIVDDDAEFRKSITRLLLLSGYDACQYNSGHQFLEQFNNEQPGCVLIDLDMPQMNGLQLQACLGARHPYMPVVFLSGRGDVRSSVKAIKAGADDFLCKPASRKELINAIERAIERNQRVRETYAPLKDYRERFEALTPRERQVYALVVAGKINKQIAHELNTSERTIKAHRQKVMYKLQARSIVELVSIYERLSSIDNAELARRTPDTFDAHVPAFGQA